MHYGINMAQKKKYVLLRTFIDRVASVTAIESERRQRASFSDEAERSCSSEGPWKASFSVSPPAGKTPGSCVQVHLIFLDFNLSFFHDLDPKVLGA